MFPELLWLRWSKDRAEGLVEQWVAKLLWIWITGRVSASEERGALASFLAVCSFWYVNGFGNMQHVVDILRGNSLRIYLRSGNNVRYLWWILPPWCSVILPSGVIVPASLGKTAALTWWSSNRSQQWHSGSLFHARPGFQLYEVGIKLELYQLKIDIATFLAISRNSLARNFITIDTGIRWINLWRAWSDETAVLTKC